jgi:hypothetical protein
MGENHVQKNQISRQEYVSRLLDAYRKTPGTTGHVRRQDRRLAGQLYEQIVPPTVVENALVLATARRLLRPENAPPLDCVRSLHYFLAVIDEVMKSKVGDEYFLYLQRKIAEIGKTKAER